jgi:hypothetical protein
MSQPQLDVAWGARRPPPPGSGCLEALGPIVTQASAVLLMLVWVAPLMQVSVAAQAQEFASAVSNLQLGTGKGQLG